MCDKCTDPDCDVTTEGKPLPFILGGKPRELFSDEFLVTATSPLGAYCGQFIAHKSTIPQLITINESKEGATYFFWEK